MNNLVKHNDTGSDAKDRIETFTIVKISILAATAALLMLFEIPVFFTPGFYKLDFSEVAVLLGAFSMGPVAGIVIEAVKILLNFVIDGSMTAGIGELANFLMGCSFVVPAAVIYKRNKTRKGAIMGLTAGTVVMVIFSAFMNLYVLLPVYAAAFKMPIDAIVQMGTKVNSAIKDIYTLVLFATVPFNILKGFLSSLITVLIYKKLSPVLHR
ncbi:riboflavin transporter RibU [Thermoclostridium stercorarium subsp. stercorarium DSM 8532]|uniref:Riboflavin transporter n=3 Tax=Thermoclostridium stercorarium TaxID=1510 RepID=L7VP40_THES1|nr:ECF transporter S component [Thermoclostridium stercorarium]AGC67313.1 riboflavin transporter RibU [Thermoclostridium stercorarium subsp. stercorarium DSM 8532]AGI38375.1 membrane protein [Thermoclostridium stercorarium subsp. stercorarium DSM 8532]UZQ85884.1 ECF transporter S component [Thermoclostridium stercorarium]